MRFSIAIASAVACLTEVQAADRAPPHIPAGHFKRRLTAGYRGYQVTRRQLFADLADHVRETRQTVHGVDWQALP